MTLKNNNNRCRSYELTVLTAPRLLELAAKARAETEHAYEFVPNSYTHGAMLAMRQVERTLGELLAELEHDEAEVTA
jgi:hypothetical protein